MAGKTKEEILETKEEILERYLWALARNRLTLRTLFQTVNKAQKDFDGLQWR